MNKYSVVVRWSDEDDAFIATSEEFPGLSAFGATKEEAVQELEVAREGFLQVMRECGDPVPEPEKIQHYSGQLRLRLPKSLHAGLAEAAKREGVSLNTYIVSLLSEQHALRRQSRPVFQVVLRRPKSLFDFNVFQSSSEVKILKKAPDVVEPTDLTATDTRFVTLTGVH